MVCGAWVGSVGSFTERWGHDPSRGGGGGGGGVGCVGVSGSWDCLLVLWVVWGRYCGAVGKWSYCVVG